MARKTDELYGAYQALIDEHLAMRKKIGATMRVFEREFEPVGPKMKRRSRPSSARFSTRFTRAALQQVQSPLRGWNRCE